MTNKEAKKLKKLLESGSLVHIESNHYVTGNVEEIFQHVTDHHFYYTDNVMLEVDLKDVDVTMVTVSSPVKKWWE
jgi:UDP-N-acetyl-D-mannosaminuronate dehydrogenase